MELPRQTISSSSRRHCVVITATGSQLERWTAEIRDPIGTLRLQRAARACIRVAARSMGPARSA